MLKSVLKGLRQKKIIGPSQALSQLATGWNAEGEGTLKRDFTFNSFEEASFFIHRFTEFCHKVNQVPSFSNVYNKVSVVLQNQEFK